jgi:hypothetical protein
MAQHLKTYRPLFSKNMEPIFPLDRQRLASRKGFPNEDSLYLALGLLEEKDRAALLEKIAARIRNEFLLLYASSKIGQTVWLEIAALDYHQLIPILFETIDGMGAGIKSLQVSAQSRQLIFLKIKLGSKQNITKLLDDIGKIYTRLPAAILKAEKVNASSRFEISFKIGGRFATAQIIPMVLLLIQEKKLEINACSFPESDNSAQEISAIQNCLPADDNDAPGYPSRLAAIIHDALSRCKPSADAKLFQLRRFKDKQLIDQKEYDLLASVITDNPSLGQSARCSLTVSRATKLSRRQRSTLIHALQQSLSDIKGLESLAII